MAPEVRHLLVIYGVAINGLEFLKEDGHLVSVGGASGVEQERFGHGKLDRTGHGWEGGEYIVRLGGSCVLCLLMSSVSSPSKYHISSSLFPHPTRPCSL